MSKKERRGRETDLYELELGRYRETLRQDGAAALQRYGMTLINSLNPAERAIALKSVGMEVTEAVDYYNLGCHFASEENWGEAIIHFKRAVEQDPHLTDAIYNLALCYEKAGHNPQAKSTWQVYVKTTRDESVRHRIHEHMAEL
ncbi:tetratricopeptide repeat protein [Candidatus Poribacteria bacterium]|nr:tetratricopeptide repeat protein [Candidatus Poribacteria bacterium]